MVIQDVELEPNRRVPDDRAARWPGALRDGAVHHFSELVEQRVMAVPDIPADAGAERSARLVFVEDSRPWRAMLNGNYVAPAGPERGQPLVPARVRGRVDLIEGVPGVSSGECPARRCASGSSSRYPPGNYP